MNILNRINRRLTINRTVRELSRLHNTMLSDIGLNRGSLTEMVEQMIDSKHSPSGRVSFEHVPNNYHVTSGATA